MSQYLVHNSSYLAHHGILGMRWGIRRFQPYPKGYTGSGKEVGEAAKSGGGGNNARPLSRREQKKADKEAKIKKQRQVENLAKARKAASDKRDREKEKERVLREGSATEVLQFKNELTTQELNNAFQRIQAIKNLENISKREQVSNFDKIDKAMNKVGKVNNWVTTGINASKNVKQILDMIDKAMEDEKKRKGKQGDS